MRQTQVSLFTIFEELTNKKYICLACQAPVSPVAIRPNMKLRPHFRLKRKHQHQPGCYISGYDTLAKVGTKQQVSTPNGFPISYPSKLRLPTQRIVTSEKNLQNPIQKPTISKKQFTNSNSSEVSVKKHNLTTTKLEEIVKHFLLFPYDRHLKLTLPRVGLTTYEKAFQKLKFNSEASYEIPLIYYAEFMYTGVKWTEEEIYFPLMQGLDPYNRNSQERFFLRIDTRHWEVSKRKLMQDKIEDCINEVKKARGQQTSSKKSPYLFFLGQKSLTEKFQFRLLLEDWRLFCCQAI